MEKIFIALSELNIKLDKLIGTSNDYLSMSEAADFLKISKSTLYKHTSARDITFYQPHGKLIVFKKVDLQAWLEQHKIDNLKNLNHGKD